MEANLVLGMFGMIIILAAMLCVTAYKLVYKPINKIIDKKHSETEDAMNCMSNAVKHTKEIAMRAIDISETVTKICAKHYDNVEMSNYLTELSEEQETHTELCKEELGIGDSND